MIALLKLFFSFTKYSDITDYFFKNSKSYQNTFGDKNSSELTRVQLTKNELRVG